ncbi:hypothetical protein DVA67_032720 [Solirubrobacter sp. CPCC 204708]|uniref:Uncharacterized protein n=1 Tax=Solirubrobacter deserti TaxID=2282478 RepID=A0ABT4RTQ7_9ACTN|nr:hypothetical protein [Solirubrobacter deserti]MBE2320769.1 hypothetical protein [Solirubrobacter deserti]MDA0141872.1 hypothetical protein [Solirubrobacter deserti]
MQSPKLLQSVIDEHQHAVLVTLIPLSVFNDHIVGRIELIATYRADSATK